MIALFPFYFDNSIIEIIIPIVLPNLKTFLVKLIFELKFLHFNDNSSYFNSFNYSAQNLPKYYNILQD